MSSTFLARTLALGEKNRDRGGLRGEGEDRLSVHRHLFRADLLPLSGPLRWDFGFQCGGLVLIYASVVLSIYSAVEYTMAFIRELARSEPNT